MFRYPAVSGRFYPSKSHLLIKELTRCITQSPENKFSKKIRATGIISPHAGLTYCGEVAAAVYSNIEIPDTIILLGPNHTGVGEQVSIMSEGAWQMPLGTIEIDHELADAICQIAVTAKKDNKAHQKEHSIETQLPFLQFYRDNFKIVPICLMPLGIDKCEELSHAIINAVEKLGRSVLIVASSDMTHYETHENASKKDKDALDQILRLDARGLFNTVHEKNISMCGVNPTVIMLMCARKIGAKEALLAKYMTSGEVSGNMDHVVGYAGVIVK
jgi:hypothetical protein